jgi:hypothetical protein
MSLSVVIIELSNTAEYLVQCSALLSFGAIGLVNWTLLLFGNGLSAGRLFSSHSSPAACMEHKTQLKLALPAAKYNISS